MICAWNTCSAGIATTAGFTISAVIAVPAVEGMVGGSGCGDSGGENSGRCVHRNCRLRMKAAFAGPAKSPTNTAFTARAAITAGPPLQMA